MVIAHGTIGKIDAFNTKSGLKLANMSLAVDNKIKKTKPDGTVGATTTTEWINCTAFGRTAELLLSACKKGDSVGVQGRINTQSYEKDGKKQYSTKVIVDRILMFPPNKETSAGKQHEETHDFVFDDNEDIPF
jgi:single-strand DNA-binding protein